MAKMLVPTLTLPQRGAIAFVATMPVPASPSGGHSGAPSSSPPVGSRSLAPSAVSEIDQWLALLRRALEANYGRLDRVLADMNPKK